MSSDIASHIYIYTYIRIYVGVVEATRGFKRCVVDW